MRSSFLCSVAILSALSMQAHATECSMALVLALDVSGSVDEAEDRLQRVGTANAILTPAVTEAFLGRAPVALFVFEWSTVEHQEPLLPGWKMVTDYEDLAEVAEVLLASRPGPFAAQNPPTAVGSALGYASMVLKDGPKCDASTIDISGDGENNDGFGPSVAYENFPLNDVTVNALVIGGAGNRYPDWDDEKLVEWFETEVVRGPGAFAIFADGYSDYERALKMKLLRELQIQVAIDQTSEKRAF